MSVLNSLIEEHFPTTTTVRHSNDKPWVTKGFKALVQDRQKALHEWDTETYRRRRNKIHRQRSRLRASFYQSKVDKIGESNSRQWWKTIKTRIGLQPSKSHVCDLADQLCGGDTLALANNSNVVFKEVTSDLQPLLPVAASVDHDVPDEFIISVTDCEQKLSKLCVHKAMGSDNIPNWILKDFSYILASPIAAIYNSSRPVTSFHRRGVRFPTNNNNYLPSYMHKHTGLNALTRHIDKDSVYRNDTLLLWCRKSCQ